MSLELKIKDKKLEKRAKELAGFIFEYLGSLNVTPMYKEMDLFEHRRNMKNVVIAKIAEALEDNMLNKKGRK